MVSQGGWENWLRNTENRRTWKLDNSRKRFAKALRNLPPSKYIYIKVYVLVSVTTASKSGRQKQLAQSNNRNCFEKFPAFPLSKLSSTWSRFLAILNQNRKQWMLFSRTTTKLPRQESPWHAEIVVRMLKLIIKSSHLHCGLQVSKPLKNAIVTTSLIITHYRAEFFQKQYTILLTHKQAPSILYCMPLCIRISLTISSYITFFAIRKSMQY